MLDDAFDVTGDFDRPRRAADAAPPRVLAPPAPLPPPLTSLPLAPAAAAFRGEDEGERAPVFLGILEEPAAPDRGVVLTAPAFLAAPLGVVGVLRVLVCVLAAPVFAALRGVRLLGIRCALLFGLAFLTVDMRCDPPIAASRRASFALATCSLRESGAAAEASELAALPLVPPLAGDRDRGVRGVPAFFLGAVLRGVVEADMGSIGSAEGSK